MQVWFSWTGGRGFTSLCPVHAGAVVCKEPRRRQCKSCAGQEHSQLCCTGESCAGILGTVRSLTKTKSKETKALGSKKYEFGSFTDSDTWFWEDNISNTLRWSQEERRRKFLRHLFFLLHKRNCAL